MRTQVTSDPLDPARITAEVGTQDDGAVLLFLGIVRNQNEGRPVSGMEYEAYEAMAESVLSEIATEAGELAGTDRIVIVHRIGRLEIGEPSVAIAVSTPHRAQAYDASRYVIEEIKKRLPVWKKEHYLDGDVAWVKGRVPEPSPARPQHD